MNKKDFYTKLSRYIQGFTDVMLLIVSSETFKHGLVVQSNLITADQFDTGLKSLNTACALGFANKYKYLEYLRSRDKEGLNSLSNEELLDLLQNPYRKKAKVLGNSKNNVTQAPFIMVDIDLADHYDYYKKLLPEEAKSNWGTLSNLNKKKYFKKVLAEVTFTKKLSMMKEILSPEEVVDQTGASIIIFTGNGYHIWYALSQDMYFNSPDEFRVLYKSFMDKIAAEDSFSNIHVDGGDTTPNRYYRLPWGVNRKGGREDPVTLLYCDPNFLISNYIRDAYTMMQDYDYSAAKSYIGKYSSKTNRGYYPVSSEWQFLQADWRLAKELRASLSFQDILDYFHLDSLSDQFNEKHDDKNVGPISSPFRKDTNPSFVYKDDLYGTYTDFGIPDEVLEQEMIPFNPDSFATVKDMEEAYENYTLSKMKLTLDKMQKVGNKLTFMKLILTHIKMKLNLFQFLPTLDSEASIHLLQAYIHKQLIENNFNIASAKIQASGEKSSKSKTLPKGFTYYEQTSSSLADTLMTWLSASTRALTNDEREKEWLTKVVTKTPRVFNFYELMNTASTPIVTIAKRVKRLLLTNFLLEHPLKLYKDSTGYKLYIQIKQIDKPFDTAYPYNRKRKKEEVDAEMQDMLHKLNFYKPRPEFSYSTLGAFMQGLFPLLLTIPEEIAQAHGDKLTSEILAEKLRKRLEDEGYVVESTIPIYFIQYRSYIRFENAYVKFNAPNYELNSIGEVKFIEDTSIGILNMNSLIPYRLPFTYDANFLGDAPPMWNRLISYNDNGNILVDSIRYFMGSVLYAPEGGNTKAIWLYGSGDNGKSAILDVIRMLFGSGYVSTEAIEAVSKEGEFGDKARFKLIDKLINITFEGTGDPLDDVFKQLVSGELVQARTLYESAINFKPCAHYIIATNKLPDFSGQLNAFLRRVLVISFTKPIAEEDKIENFAEKIIQSEASKIWPWIIKQARQYREKGLHSFISKETMKTKVAEMKSAGKVGSFIDKFLKFHFLSDSTPNPKYKLTYDKMRNIYSKYEKGVTGKLVSSDTFFEDLSRQICTEILSNKQYMEQAPDNFVEKINQQHLNYRTREFRGVPGVEILILESDSNLPFDLSTK